MPSNLHGPSHRRSEAAEGKALVTVHVSDDEAAKIWIEEIGSPRPPVPIRRGQLWQMGDTGPTVRHRDFFDHGPEVPGGL